jgi:hypothetical protein
MYSYFWISINGKESWESAEFGQKSAHAPKSAFLGRSGARIRTRIRDRIDAVIACSLAQAPADLATRQPANLPTSQLADPRYFPDDYQFWW